METLSFSCSCSSTSSRVHNGDGALGKDSPILLMAIVLKVTLAPVSKPQILRASGLSGLGLNWVKNFQSPWFCLFCMMYSVISQPPSFSGAPHWSVQLVRVLSCTLGFFGWLGRSEQMFHIGFNASSIDYFLNC